MRRRAEAERDLSRARGTNFENPDTSQVSIGTVVTLRASNAAEETYCILGAWDSAPRTWKLFPTKPSSDKPSSARPPGESAELPMETGSRIVTIVRIEPFTNLDDLREKVHPLSEPATA